MVTAVELIRAVTVVGHWLGDLPVCSLEARETFDRDHGEQILVDVQLHSDRGLTEVAALILAGRFGLAGPEYHKGIVSYSGFVPALGYVVSTFGAACDRESEVA